MNGTSEFKPFPHKPPSSPRPPAVGEEVKVFNDESDGFFAEHYLNRKKMEDQSKAMCEGEKSEMSPCHAATVFENAKCPEVSPSPNPSPPPPLKWAQSLQCLLDDRKGVDLFEQFLKQEGHDTRSLSFWFACRGVKKTDPNDTEKLHKLIKVLYEKKVKRISAISPVTKSEIKHKLDTNMGVDVNIFDDAQEQVEAHMLKTTYPNFLTSDLYLQHLESVQSESAVEHECPGTPEATDLLPTVHEDSELDISVNKAQQAKESFLSRRSLRASCKGRSEGQATMHLKSPYRSYSNPHAIYAPFLPASAQDSELQSLSSDAQTDDTMSQTDSSIDFPMHTRSKQKRPLKTKCYGFLNKDKLNHQNFIPRTQRPATEAMKKTTPDEFHALLVERLHKVIEEQKAKDRVNERLKAIEGLEPSKTEALSNQKFLHKGFEIRTLQPFSFAPTDENDQAILDQHVSRVFKDTGLTPVLSPVCASPPVMKNEDPLRIAPVRQVVANASILELQHNSQKVGIPSPFAVPYAMKCRRDHDTHSNDSGALTEWISEDNLQSCQRSVDYSCSSDNVDYPHQRPNREQLKRYMRKKLAMADSASSCVDSGISVACESLPSHSKVTHWLETKRCASESEKDHQWRNSSTSPVLSRSSSSRKAVMYNSTRPGVLDPGSTHWPLVPSQPVAQDPSMPALPAPDTTTNLLEARRRLEDESRTKMGKSKYTSAGRNSHDITRARNSFRAYNAVDDGISHRKQCKKSSGASGLEYCPQNMGSNDVTIVGYSFGRESVPYKSRLPGKNITLRQFKSHLNKKGNFRYFFKRISDDFGTGVVLEEVTDDSEVLPLWEGKVFCVIEVMDDNPMNED